MGHEVLHCIIDEAATLAWLCQAIDGMHRGFRQNNVDAFAHGNAVNDLVCIVYTLHVCVKLRSRSFEGIICLAASGMP